MNSVEIAPIKTGMRVLVRCDLDVPLENSEIIETFRLEQALPTLKLIIQKGGVPVILGHIGRPKSFEPSLSTQKLKPFFDKYLGIEKYDILENLRFNSGEESSSLEFAQEISKQGEIYVNESFATSHREHASMVLLPRLLPAYAGVRLLEETRILSEVTKNPKRPFLVLIGGAKLESKKPLVKKFLTIADGVLIGGKIGLDWDESIPEHLFLPKDYAEEEKDIGPLTIEMYEDLIKTSKTILWAGPMGMYEDSKYIMGTAKIAEAINSSQNFSVIGGGDIISALRKCHQLNKINFVSTGGSAMLEFLVNGQLPALKVLEENV